MCSSLYSRHYRLYFLIQKLMRIPKFWYTISKYFTNYQRSFRLQIKSKLTFFQKMQLQMVYLLFFLSSLRPINNFIIWSLARHLLPHLSKEYRNLVENFDYTVYGRTANHPRWMICTKVVKEWLPFAVDALQQNKEMRTVRKVFYKNY